MTEVEAEEGKRGSGKWPWLLLLLVPVIWFAMRGRGDETAANAGDTATAAAAKLVPSTIGPATNAADTSAVTGPGPGTITGSIGPAPTDTLRTGRDTTAVGASSKRPPI